MRDAQRHSVHHQLLKILIHCETRQYLNSDAQILRGPLGDCDWFFCFVIITNWILFDLVLFVFLHLRLRLR